MVTEKNVKSTKVFRFVINEVIRIHDEILSSTYFPDEDNDGLAWIQTPTKGIKIIGLEAERQLYRLARQKITKDEVLLGHADEADLVAEFKKELGKEIESDTGRSASEIVNMSIETVQKSLCYDRTYFVPCILPEHSKISSFKIGPVRFWRSHKLLPNLLEEMIGKNGDDFAKFSEQKKLYNWIAEVKLSGFNNSKGREQAYLFVRLAISGMKCCLPEDFSRWFGTDEQLMPLLLNFSIERIAGHNARVLWSKRFILNVDDEDIKILFSQGQANWFELLGSFLEQYITRGDFGFIGNRIIIALVWGDTGTSPLNAAQRVIAYSNCLESIFVTDDIGKRTQISRRSVPFLKLIDTNTDWDANIKTFYGVRSSLVHGEISPNNDSLKRQIRLGKQLTDNSLIGMLNFTAWLLRKYPTETTHKHLSPFNGRGSFSKAMDDHLDEFIAGVRVIEVN